MNIPFAQTPEEGLLTGGQPTEADFQAAVEAGFKTVINTRGLGEPGTEQAPALMASLGLDYVHLPINGAGDITPQNAQALADAMASAQRPLMIHCASGNRVGALFALNAFLKEGQSIDAAIQTGRNAGLTRLEPFVRSLLENGPAA